MDQVSIISTTPDTISSYAFCGYKNPKTDSYQKKLQWLKDQFPLGLRYNILHSEEKGAIGGIEYIPGEYAWRPVDAKGFLFIHCVYIMVKDYKGKGYGSLLVESSIEDAKNNGFNGVAVVARKGTWMASGDLFKSSGFECIESFPPDFELWVLKLKENCELPKFRVKDVPPEASEGLTIYYSDQCPYLAKTTPEIMDTATNELGLKPQFIKLETAQDAQNTPCAYGTCCLVYNGAIISDKPTSNGRFKNLAKKF